MNEPLASNAPYQLGRWRIDPGACEIRDDVRAERVEPRAMAVLSFLAEHQGRTVSREELLDAIWKTRHVVEEALTKCISQLRQVLDDDPRRPTYIQTVPKLGYRLLVAPTPIAQAPARPAEVVAPAAAPLRNDASAELARGGSAATWIRRYRIVLAAGAALVIVAAAVVLGPRLAAPLLRHKPVSISFNTPASSGLVEFTAAPMALTKNGESAILALADAQGSRLWRRRMDSNQLEPIPGSEGATSPFLSPDGQWIAFAGGGKIKRINIEGGEAHVIANAEQFFGGCWLNDQTIVFAPRFARGLWRAPASGGTPVQLTTPSGADNAHIWPACLPDGKTILYSQWRGGSRVDQSAIAFTSADGSENGVIIEGGYHPRYLSSGELLYVRAGALQAVAFDMSSRVVRGPARTVINGVLTNINSQVAFYETSNSAHLIVVQGRYEQPQRRLVWVDRQGAVEEASRLRQPFSSPRLSADGHRAAVWLQDDAVGIWQLDLDRDRLAKVSRGLDDHCAVWSPDGARLAFDSSRSGRYQLYVASAERAGEEVQLTQEPRDHFVNAWLPDGQLVYTTTSSDADSDVWLIDARSGAEPQPLLRSPFSESEPAISADGRWLAYVSEESGRKEVYVQRFAEAGERVQVSSEGGEEPMWSRDGHELFFRRGAHMLAAQVRGDRDPIPSEPVVLFSGAFHYNLYPASTYDVAADGRFLMVEEPAPQPRTIRVIRFAGENR